MKNILMKELKNKLFYNFITHVFFVVVILGLNLNNTISFNLWIILLVSSTFACLFNMKRISYRVMRKIYGI